MACILVVDDSPSTLLAMREMLAADGHEVVACASGKAAREALRSRLVDLVITDIYMPDEDGLEFIRACRKDHCGIPIVAVSGMTGGMNMLAVAAHLGACRTIQKPVTLTALRAAVSCLRQH